MIILTKRQILLLHSQLIQETGGSDGIRDEALLDAAINAPFQSCDGEDVFPTIQQKAARLGYGLVKNHAFMDGNKRIGAHAMLVFLALNDIDAFSADGECGSCLHLGFTKALTGYCEVEFD